MILLYSTIDDISAQKVSNELNRREINYHWLIVKDFVKNVTLTHRLKSSQNSNNIILQNDHAEVDLNDISVIFLRFLGDIIVEKLKDNNLLNGWITVETKNYFRETLEMLDCLWFPCQPTYLQRLEDEKLKELYVALEVGLIVPDTLVTNNTKLAIDFYRRHQGRIITKRYHSSRTKYKGADIAFPTSPVSLRDIGFVSHIKYAPSLFQEYIPKQKELRITVVGENAIAAEIDSQKAHHTKHDWRNYDRNRTPYTLHELPREIHDKLVALVKKRGLNYGTCDMVITPKGEYVFLEINPAGQYAWIENILGVDITGLICDELIALSEKHKADKLRISNDIK